MLESKLYFFMKFSFEVGGMNERKTEKQLVKRVRKKRGRVENEFGRIV